MIAGIGIDIIKVSRIKAAIKRNKRFMTRIFTPHEIQYCLSKKECYQCFAARFAAKEAIFKAIGRGLAWKEVEIINRSDVRLKVNFYGKAKAILSENKEIKISISHSHEYAIAQAIVLKKA